MRHERSRGAEDEFGGPLLPNAGVPLRAAAPHHYYFQSCLLQDQGGAGLREETREYFAKSTGFQKQSLAQAENRIDCTYQPLLLLENTS